MFEWHNEELGYDDIPDGISVYLIGTGKVSNGSLLVRLGVKFVKLSERIRVVMREKNVKIWPAHLAYDINETELSEKYMGWVEKFHRTNKNFKSVVLKAAAKADRGTAVWLLSMQH